MGRPSEYSQEIANEICTHIMDGKSLRQIEAIKGMPARTTILRWLNENKDFQTQYARAREEQADSLADDILGIADDKTLDPNDKRVRVDARKWIASKLKPKVYGDRSSIDLKAEVTIEKLTDEQLNSELTRLAAEAGVTLAAGGEGETEA